MAGWSKDIIHSSTTPKANPSKNKISKSPKQSSTKNYPISISPMTIKVKEKATPTLKSSKQTTTKELLSSKTINTPSIQPRPKPDPTIFKAINQSTEVP